MNKVLAGISLVLIFTGGNSYAADASDVKEKWHTSYGLYLTPQEAFDMKSANPDSVIFLDVRTRAEVKFVGMAETVDANIPVRFLDADYAWSEKSNTYRTFGNDDFVSAVDKLLAQRKLDKKAKIILMCQSGSRAPKAAEILHEAGYATVYTQYQGFEGLKAKEGENKGKRVVNGWKNAGLPWGYKLEAEKMYFSFTEEK